MISNRILLSGLEDWIKKNNPNKTKLVWVNYAQEPIFNNICDLNGAGQSFILKYICEKSNIPYEIYLANHHENDKDRLLEFSNFISWKSDNYNTILIGKVLKEQLHFGEYKKYYFDILDILPFGQINQSQIDNLVHYIKTEEDLHRVSEYSRLEWLYHEDVNYGIISSDKDPAKHFKWGTYSLEQRSLIAKFYAATKNRNYKIKIINIFNHE